LARIFNKYRGEIAYFIAMKEDHKETPNYSVLFVVNFHTMATKCFGKYGKKKVL